MKIKTKQKKMEKNLVRILSSKYIPTLLKDELNKFIKRNLVEHTDTFCPNCLKAHALKKSQEFNLDKSTIGKISTTLEEAGHNGYYLDKNKLIEFNL